MRSADTRRRFPLAAVFPFMAQPVQPDRRVEQWFSTLLNMVAEGDGHERIGLVETGHNLPEAIAGTPPVAGRVLGVGAPDMADYFFWQFGYSHGDTPGLTAGSGCATAAAL